MCVWYPSAEVRTSYPAFGPPGHMSGRSLENQDLWARVKQIERGVRHRGPSKDVWSSRSGMSKENFLAPALRMKSFLEESREIWIIELIDFLHGLFAFSFSS